MAVKLGFAVGDTVVVRADYDCRFCAVERVGSAGRIGRVASIDEFDQLTPASNLPADHYIFVLYNTPFRDGVFGTVRGQFFKASELYHFDTE